MPVGLMLAMQLSCILAEHGAAGTGSASACRSHGMCCAKEMLCQAEPDAASCTRNVPLSPAVWMRQAEFTLN